MRPRRFVLAAAAAALLAACDGSSRPIVVTTSAQAPDGITVTGVGEVHAQPDVARVSLGVDVRAASAAEAVNEANAAMRAVLAAVKDAGVADRDLRTNQVAVHRELEPPFEPPPPPPEPLPAPQGRPGDPSPPAPPPPPAPAPARPREGFRASNTVEITVRDLDRVGAIVSAATSAGANQVHGVFFTLDDPTRVEAHARHKAMADARARAEQLARLGGVELGAVLSIQDGERGGWFPPPIPMQAMRADPASGGMPVERGELKISRQVVVRYAIVGR